jgi:hypothetical protein
MLVRMKYVLKMYSLYSVHTVISIKVNTISEHHGNLLNHIPTPPPEIVPPSCSAHESLWTEIPIHIGNPLYSATITTYH